MSNKIVLFTIDSEYKSACRLGFDTYYYLYDHKIEDYDNFIVIRWGCGSNAVFKDGKEADFKNVINPVKSIQLNIKKKMALKKISECATTPKIFEKYVPKNKFVVYRPDNHSGGRGFKVNKGPFRIQKYFYATEFINCDREFRVFFCNNKTLMCRRITYNKDKMKEQFKCRSLWNYSFYKRVPNNLHEQIITAANKLKLEFGAFDILYKNGKYYFLECNTAPTLDNKLIVSFFKDNLLELIKKKFPDSI